ncbi:Protein NifX [[Clostridium] ultunense Esp]|uniref:nitrogen fixation protein NifX n=1 Tax=Thermicanus aegyptius TaxID=94009 RepID=UPI0002B6F116|nr:nitrogen fixation protein NifX [Thermicanus aegyptius]CCQ92507.1 Protein NifX [[Clostridium] ultunense Esp]
MKVAFATEDGSLVNSHFGQCNTFIIYEVTLDGYRLDGVREIMGKKEEEGDEYGRLDRRIDAIEDCTLLFITQIGPSAAARVTRKKIMPIKVEEGTPILQQLDRLLVMLHTKPPLWLAKALKHQKGEEES